MFNAVLKWQYYPTVWKHARVISLLRPGKDPALPSSYRPISLLNTVRKIFEKILLSRIMTEIKSRGLLRGQQLGFRPEVCTTLQLTGLLEKDKRYFVEKRLSGTIFIHVAKAFVSVWIEGLLEFP